MTSFQLEPNDMNMMKAESITLSTLLLTLLAAQAAGPSVGAATAAANQSVAPAVASLVYKNVGERELKLFIEKPRAWKATDQRPAIVFFFGGGWVGGTPEQFRKQSEYLASRGMVGVRVEYRPIPKGEKGPPTLCVQDAKSAMRWVRAHARELGVDPQRIAAGGGSAGGHLAAFTSLVPGSDDPADDLMVSPRANALVLFNPVFNNGPGQWGHELVGHRYLEFSPAHHITSNAPPTIVFLGTKDGLISVETAQEFQAAMKQAGVRCEAFFYEGQVHGFFNRDPWRTGTMIETDTFLATLGWLQGEPTLAVPAAAR
jgi:acetyl esterase/lipase